MDLEQCQLLEVELYLKLVLLLGSLDEDAILVQVGELVVQDYLDEDVVLELLQEQLGEDGLLVLLQAHQD